ncbi:alpha/beta hydrolase [Solihabitans fulvus]|uniref:Alpha/beta hydrolase n=1 Tax=Solihabitans fulvus TaxID=1892852 RepID=A0A5B2WTY2_9PSEU|nr:alpha/beta hydrolase [Solihabitans fulvus]
MLLPGTGSDEVFVRAVFAGPLLALGLPLTAPAPVPGVDLVRHHLAALDAAAERGPVLVGGISLGAHVAANWAVRNQDRCAGLLAALPAWHGPAPSDAPAAWAARASAAAIERDGLAATLRASTEGVAGWLSAELHRAWTRHGDGLAASLRAAAAYPGPDLADLRGLDVPAGIAACSDDPVHPAEEADVWAAALPNAVARRTTLAAMAADREALGRAALLAWLSAARHRAGVS